MIMRYRITEEHMPVVSQIVAVSGGSVNTPPDGEVDIAKNRTGMEMLAAMAAPREGVTVTTADAGDIPIEVILPENAEASRIILFLHGGAYLFGSARTHREITTVLAQKAYAKAFVPNYRLAPEYPFPAALNDAVETYRWLLDKGYRPDAITLAGDSAGGGLALCTMLRLKELVLPMPAAITLFSPWTKLDASTEELITRYKGEDVTRNDLWYKARLYAGDEPLTNPLISPVYGDFTGCPPILIQVGGNERLLEDSTWLYEALLRSRVNVELQIWDGGVHVFQAFPSVLPEGEQALTLAGEFIAKHAKNR